MGHEITITDVRLKKNGELNPLIVEFQHGEVLHEKLLELKAELIPPGNAGEKTVQVSSKGGHKFVDSSTNALAHKRIVAIRNRNTNKVKLVEVEFMSLLNSMLCKKSIVRNEEMNLNEKLKELKIKFGTKRAIRKLEEDNLIRFDKSCTKEEISEILADQRLNEPSLLDAEENDFSYLGPPCNREAKTVSDVYKINNCLSSEELMSLMDGANKVLDTKHDSGEKSEFLKQHLKEVVESAENVEIKVCCLLYAEALLVCLKTPIRQLRKIASSLCPSSEIISNKIIREFCTNRGSLWSRPVALKDKAMCYLIVLILIACNYKIDLVLLAKQSGYGLKKVKKLSKIIGLVPTGKNSNIHALILPLPSLPKPVSILRSRR